MLWTVWVDRENWLVATVSPAFFRWIPLQQIKNRLLFVRDGSLPGNDWKVLTS
jgi:hypothetical protein